MDPSSPGDRRVAVNLGRQNHLSGGALPIFRHFRQFLAAIQGLSDALTDLAHVQQDLGPASDRLDALERSRHHFEAECEGMLLKADGKLKAAASAEQRERQLKKANDRLSVEFDPASEEGQEPAPVPSDDAQRGEGQGVPAVRLALATNNKAHAVRTKWGM